MTASSVELEQLKRRLIMEYEEELNALLGARAAAAERDGLVPIPSATPSYLYQQLLCLRAGRPYGVGVPTTASETVQLLAESQPPLEVMLMQRLHKAQDESIQLLAIHSAATMAAVTARESAERDAGAAAAAVDDATAGDEAHEEVAIKPLTAEDRMALLSRLAKASPSPSLAEPTTSKSPSVAGNHAHDDVATDKERVADACEDEGRAEETTDEEVVEEME
ncbi:hypothetical protein LSCM1_06046 [Leishmania martiniquensis]|uniref:Uncharacterized protein n=1 Tax=Leishmania martiniquensis TaxID=1580590 RepID=A0A836KML3_9TRYP|nr:hypothetical protein LSCM1_06046 [Leishmania martiniquensis]